MARHGHAVDVADVKKMLRMADLEWANNGLIAHDKGDSSTNFRMMRVLDAMSGEFPEAIPGAVEDQDQMVGNLFFSIFNTMKAQTSARDPEVVIRPLGGTAAEPDAWRRAWLNQKVVQSMIREKKFRREWDRALQCALISPFAIVRHGYTPDLEEYEKDGVIHARHKNETPDFPWTRFVRPWQVRIDPLVNNFDMDGEPGWIAFQNLYRSRREIEDNPALIARDDWEPDFHYDMRPFHERKKPQVIHSGEPGRKGKNNPDSLSLYEEWVVYDANRRTFYGVSHSSDSLVREERDWPLEWGQLPASILTFNEQLDSPFGIPFPQMIWNDQMLFNRIWTILNSLVSRTRRIVLVNKGGFVSDDAQLQNLINPDSLAEFIIVDGPVNEIVNEISISPIDGQLVGLLFQVKEQIREVLGISNFDRGQRANVETASEANQIGAGGALARSRVQGKFEDFLVDVIRSAHRALLQTEDAREFFIPIIGEQNTLFLTEDEIAKGFIQVGLEDLQGEFDYGVKLNSTTPLDPTAELAKAAQIYQIIGGEKGQMTDHNFVQKRIVQLGGEDPESWIIPEEIAVGVGNQNPEGGAAGGGNAPQQPQGNAGDQGLAGVIGGAS